jgi:hypothetical protein
MSNKAKVATKPVAAKKAAVKPGVIAVIVQMLSKASAEKPVSKDRMVSELKRRFPTRKEAALRITVNCQVPYQLRENKGVQIGKNDKGYFLTAPIPTEQD